MNSKKLILLAIVTLLSLSSISAISTNVYALPQSSNVALVPDNWGLNSHGGSLPTAGFPGGFSPTFTNLDPVNIRDDATDPIAAGGFDTVVLVMIDYIQNWLADATFKSRIDNFVFNGGKLIIIDSENTHNDYTQLVFSHLPEGNLAFTADTPGAAGSWSGDLWIVENNTLGTNNTLSSSYVNTAVFHDNIDIGDSNVMVTQSPNWCTHMVAKNVYGVEGPVQTYARYGSGLIIYNGLDLDYLHDGDTIANDNDAVHNWGYIWYLMLKQQWNPDNLPCGVRTSGITVTPNTATNPVGTTHDITATVRDNLANPISGVTVNFTIYAGPSVATSGWGITNANGEAYFSWSSAVSGTDYINASAYCPFKPEVIIYDDTATKTWGITPVIPEYPIGTIMGLLAFFGALAVFVVSKRVKLPFVSAKV